VEEERLVTQFYDPLASRWGHGAKRWYEGGKEVEIDRSCGFIGFFVLYFCGPGRACLCLPVGHAQYIPNFRRV
jgi:hypothetical protein